MFQLSMTWSSSISGAVELVSAVGKLLRMDGFKRLCFVFYNTLMLFCVCLILFSLYFRQFQGAVFFLFFFSICLDCILGIICCHGAWTNIWVIQFWGAQIIIMMMIMIIVIIKSVIIYQCNIYVYFCFY